MSGEINPRLGPVPRVAPRDPDHLPRPVQRRVDEEAGDALVAATRVQGIGFVSHVGLQEVAGLSQEEAQATEQTPHATARLALIVDTATTVIAEEIARLRYRRR